MLNAKQYFVEFSLSMLLYLAAILLSVYFVARNPDSSWVVWVSLLPILPTLLTIKVVVRNLRTLDEMQQRIQLKSLAISFVIVGLTTFTYGFLENVGYPHIPLVWIFPFMIATWGICVNVLTFIYR